MRRILLLLFLFALRLAQAQPGTLDASFNPTDVGFGQGEGANGGVTSTLELSNGKLLIAGLFDQYNSSQVKYLARLNSDGTLDKSFAAANGFNGSITRIAMQGDGKILVAGSFTVFNGIAKKHIARLNTDGTLDASFNTGTGANAYILSMAIQNDGKIVICGYFTFYDGVGRNYIARLNSDGSLDPTFDPGTGAGNGVVTSVAIQPDGKILAGGWFTSFNGVARNRITRLNNNGSLDATFSIGSGADMAISSIHMQSDGKIIIGGYFNSYNGTARNRIARINSNGTIDATFNPGTGLNDGVESVKIQNDGKLIIVGNFTTYNGTARNRIARITSNGSLDATFNPGTGADAQTSSITILSSGKILVGGLFTFFNGSYRKCLAQLNTDGSLDAGFNPGSGANNDILAVAMQKDGKILIGGKFDQFNGVSRNRIARLNSDGSLDVTFNPGTGVSGIVHSIALQSDGKILIGGYIGSYNGTFRNSIARLNADGSLDATFNPGTGANNGGGTIRAIALQSDGKILIGGNFFSFNLVERNNIARLNANGSVDMSFNPGTGTSGEIITIALQSTGKALIGGYFNTYNGTVRNSIARINSDGSLDAVNTSVSPNSLVNIITIQSNEKILIGGSFTSYNGISRNGIARLNSNCSVDPLFDPLNGVQGQIITLIPQGNGKVLIGGDFWKFNGVDRRNIARLNSDGSLDLSYNTGAGAHGTFLPAVYSLALQSNENAIIGGNFVAYNNSGKNRIARVMGGELPPPATFTLTGGGTFCSTNTGVPIGLSGSETGVSYQLKKDGNNVGSPVAGTGSAISFGNQTAAGTYTVTATGTTSLLTAEMSGTATVQVTQALTPSVSIAASATTIAPGTSVTFTATAVNVGSAPVYQWKKNGQDVGENSATYEDAALSNGDVIGCVLTSNAPCVTAATAAANNITISLTHSITASPLLSNSLCQNAPLTISFTANGAFAADNVFTAQLSDAWGNFDYPVYLGEVAGSESGQYTIDAFVPAYYYGTDFRIRVVAGNPEIYGTVAGNITIKESPTYGEIMDGDAASICNGGTVQLSTGQADNYQWYKDDVAIPGATEQAYTATALGRYKVILQNTNGCSLEVPFSLTPITPYIRVSASQTVVCAGTPVTFTTQVSDEGSNPSYQWKKNGLNVGGNNSTYTDAGLKNGDVITCVLTNNDACTVSETSEELTIQVNEIPVVNLSGATKVGGTLTLSTDLAPQKVAWQHNGNTISTAGVTVVAGGNGFGSAANQLYNPQGVAVDTDGNLYVADGNNQRVQKWVPGATTGETVAGGNGYGSAANQLYAPQGIAVDATGNLYVADGNNHRVQKWAPGATSGVTVAGGNGAGSAANQLNYPTGIAMDASGNLYIADGSNHRIQKWAPGANTGVTIAGGNGAGSAANQLNHPADISLDAVGALYIADYENHRIQKWTPGANAGTTIAGGNGGGNAANQLYFPSTVFVDPMGNAYIGDLYFRLLKWAPGASAGVTLIGTNNILLPNTGIVLLPEDIAGTANGELYVSDFYNGGRVQKINTNTSYTYTPTLAGSYSAVVTSMYGCTVSSNTVTISGSETPAIAIASSATSICPGTSVTFTATPTHGGTTPAYQWKKNGVDVGTNSSTYTDAALNNGDEITCVLTSNEAGASTPNATSNKVVITVKNAPVATISTSGSTTICTGSSVSLYAPAGYSYLWSNGATTQAITVTTAGNYSVTITTTEGCSATSQPVSVTIGTQTFYLDADKDGFGRNSNTVVACSAPAGYVSKGNDCNDWDITVYPGAPEICDRKDNDCNGLIDDGLPAITFYLDADKDGFGRNSNTVVACSAPAGYVSKGNDCNDWDITVYPGAPELKDGKDNDCNGIKDDLAIVTAPLSLAARQGVTATVLSESELKATVAPNPSTTYFTLQLQSGSTEAITLQVWDAVGRLVEVKRGVAANSTLQLGHSYANGVYLVQITQGKEKATLKLIKQKG